MMPSGPVLVPGVNYSILSPESGQGFGVYYSQANGSFKCPFGGKAMDIHDNYGSFWWKPICKVMDFDSSKIDPLRSVEILMHSNPEKRTIRYRNDY